MVRFVSAALILLPCSSFGATLHESQTIRREPIRSVSLSASGEVTEETSWEDRAVGSSDQFCDFDFPLGADGTNNCTDTSLHNLIIEEALCMEAAEQAGENVTAKANFKIGIHWEKEHPVGCFKNNGYWFNANGNWPPLPVTGSPVCSRPKHMNGTKDGNGGCPDGYEVIMDETTCRQSATCLGYPKATQFRTGEHNSSRKLDHPKGCWVDENDRQGTAYFNEASAMGVGTHVEGTPICIVTVSTSAAAAAAATATDATATDATATDATGTDATGR